MSILFSVLALSGDKGAAVQSARDDLIAAATLAVKDGNTRNLDDTAARMRADGAVTKAGEYAKSKKGMILASFVGAMNSTTAARLAYMAAYPSFKGKPTAAMVDHASRLACTIGDEFEQAVILATAPKKAPVKAEKPAPAAGEEGAAQTAGEEGAAPVATPEKTDDFAVFMADAVKALGRDAIKSLLTAAIEAAKAAEGAAIQEEAKKAPKQRKAA